MGERNSPRGILSHHFGTIGDLCGAVWGQTVAKHGLQKNPLNAVVSAWHADADLGRVTKNFNDITKRGDMGFAARHNPVQSITDAFDMFPSTKVLPVRDGG